MLDPSALLKLFYTLRLVCEVKIRCCWICFAELLQNVGVSEGEGEAKQKQVSEWSAVFLNEGGFQHLYGVLMGLDLDQVTRWLLVQAAF